MTADLARKALELARSVIAKYGASADKPSVRLAVAVLRAERVVRFARDTAEGDCEYGDGCPIFGSRHGRCVRCQAVAALDALDGAP